MIESKLGDRCMIELKLGDRVRLNGDNHSMVVVGKSTYNNADCAYLDHFGLLKMRDFPIQCLTKIEDAETNVLFSVGDVVIFSGKMFPIMTIRDIQEDRAWACCIWFYNGELHQQNIPLVALRRVGHPVGVSYENSRV